MVNKRKPPMLDGPIPGQSLTSEPGARPWEKPPRYPTVEDTVTFYIENLSQPKKLARMLDQIEEGAPLTLIADTLQTLGVDRGLHSLDVGILITPVLIEFMKATAEEAEVPYVIGTEEEDVADEEDQAMAQEVASDLFKETRFVDDLLNEKKNTAQSTEESEDSEEQENDRPSKGLMARKKPMPPVEEEDQEDGV